MADYEKMTVANLRILLKERGIPATGLTRKAQIVAKLQEADAANASAPAEEPAQEITAQEEEPSPAEAAAPTVPPAEAPVATKSPLLHATASVQDEAPPATPTKPTDESKPPSVQLSASQTPVPSKEEVPIEVAVETMPPPSREATAGISQADTDVDERMKRKRRSMSPPVDTQEIAIKKARVAEKVHLKEDVANAQADTGHEDAKMADAKDFAEEASQKQPQPRNESIQEKEDKTPKDVEMMAEKVASPKIERRSTRDTINQQLLPTDSNIPKPPQPSFDELPTPEPAIHAATRALYMRNFMRPLQLNALKRHLEVLSGSSDKEPIEKLHIDSIRSHAFVLASSQSVAARIRAGTHDQVWPKERDRKPLWVDYIPEEKVQQWIDVENDAGGGSRLGSKKWEVVYEKENGEMVAELREVGASGGSAPSRPDPTPREQRDGPASLSSAPPVPKAPQPQEAAKSFIALDKLFQSTKAKPMLYFMPVKAEVADKRLDELEDAASRKWTIRDWRDDDELHRYTFEDDKLVDSGEQRLPVWVRAQQEARVTGGRGNYGRFNRGRPRGGGWRR